VGLHAANAVYTSIDSKGRLNRRISKEDLYSTVVLNRSYDLKRTAYKNDVVSYINKYRVLA